MVLKQGYTHVYTGSGKGKTTAALGLALRAAGAGFRVYFAQFLKGQATSERRALERFDDLIDLRVHGGDRFIFGRPGEEDCRAAREGLAQARRALESGRHQMVVLDEANVAAALGAFSLEELLACVDARPPHVELVLTGRNAPPEIVERADLVTEMLEIRHYYARGVSAREGIEF